MKRLLMAAMLSLGACVAHVGHDFNMAENLPRLEPGMSQQQVVSMLGNPTSTAVQSDGTVRLMWVHARGTIAGATSESLLLEFREGRLLSVPRVGG